MVVGGGVASYWLVGWLFWAYRPFETVFQSISGRLPERGRKREMTDERKNVQTTPHPHLLQAQKALALLRSKLVGRPSTGSLPSTIAPPDHPRLLLGVGLGWVRRRRGCRPTSLFVYWGGWKSLHWLFFLCFLGPLYDDPPIGSLSVFPCFGC